MQQPRHQQRAHQQMDPGGSEAGHFEHRDHQRNDRYVFDEVGVRADRAAQREASVVAKRRAVSHPPPPDLNGEDGIEQGEVEHTFISVTADGKVDRLIEELEKDRDLALVFVRTKRGADRLARKLHQRDIPAGALHGDMSQGQRERALAKFRAGKVTTLIATDVAARGLDLSDITHVINYDPPEDGKAYVHRVGRTGRAGRGGTGITFVLPDQQGDVGRYVGNLGHRDSFESTGMQAGRARKVYTSRRGRGSRW